MDRYKYYDGSGYTVITNGDSKSTQLVNPNGKTVWGVREIHLFISPEGTQALVKRYVPDMWADFTSSTNYNSFTTLKNARGEAVIIEERLVNVKIKNPITG